MTGHPDQDLITRCIAGAADEADLQHLRACTDCRREHARSERVLTAFRSTADEWSLIEAIAPKRQPSTLQGLWLIPALLGLFLASGITVSFSHFRAQRIHNDAVLFNHVRADLARPVPSGMLPLLTLVNPDPNTPEETLP